jgi:hypothetical protein
MALLASRPVDSTSEVSADETSVAGLSDGGDESCALDSLDSAFETLGGMALLG